NPMLKGYILSTATAISPRGTGSDRLVCVPRPPYFGCKAPTCPSGKPSARATQYRKRGQTSFPINGILAFRVVIPPSRETLPCDLQSPVLRYPLSAPQ